jgi:hypothetical protein
MIVLILILFETFYRYEMAAASVLSFKNFAIGTFAN